MPKRTVVRTRTRGDGDLANAVANNGSGRARTTLELSSRRVMCQRPEWTTTSACSRTWRSCACGWPSPSRSSSTGCMRSTGSSAGRSPTRSSLAFWSGSMRAWSLLATDGRSFSSPVAVAAATLTAAALFNPLRRRVQKMVDRRFNRARYDADQTLAAFAGRLQDAVDLDSVQDDLAGVVQHAWNPPAYRYGSASTTEARTASAPSPSHRSLRDWPGDTGQVRKSDIQWTPTCGYGFRRTGRTHGIDLRVRRCRPCHIRATHDSNGRSNTVTTGSSLQAPSRTEPYHRIRTGPRYRSSKLVMRVRFPSPAPTRNRRSAVAQVLLRLPLGDYEPPAGYGVIFRQGSVQGLV